MTVIFKWLMSRKLRMNRPKIIKKPTMKLLQDLCLHYWMNMENPINFVLFAALKTT